MGGLGGGGGGRREDIGAVGGEGGDHLIDLRGCEMVLLLFKGKQTLAMAMYSMNTDIRFVIKRIRRARRELYPSIRAIDSGPRSLQARSIRRICELST